MDDNNITHTQTFASQWEMEWDCPRQGSRHSCIHLQQPNTLHYVSGFLFFDETTFCGRGSSGKLSQGGRLAGISGV